MILATMPFTAIIAQASEYQGGEEVLSSNLQHMDKLYSASTITMDGAKYDIKIDGETVATVDNGSTYEVERCLRFERITKGFFNNASLNFRTACENYLPATCTAPAVCNDCYNIVAPPVEHYFEDATCTAPATCRMCGLTEGKALGHSYIIDENGNPVCKRCSALPPEREYTRTTPIDKIRTGELVKLGYSMSVSASGRTEIDVYIDGVSRDYYNTSTNVVAPNCLKCTSNTTTQGESIVIVQFKSNCLYTEPTEDHPATCVYCGKEKPATKSMTASTISKGNIVIIVAMSLAAVGAMAIFAIIYQKKKKCKTTE